MLHRKSISFAFLLQSFRQEVDVEQGLALTASGQELEVLLHHSARLESNSLASSTGRGIDSYAGAQLQPPKGQTSSELSGVPVLAEIQSCETVEDIMEVLEEEADDMSGRELVEALVR